MIGSALGLAGTFVPSASLRGLLWGLDGIALVVAAALLTIHYFRKGEDIVAAGFLVFVAGEALILSVAAMELAASGPVFGAGAGLWAASLGLSVRRKSPRPGFESPGRLRVCCSSSSHCNCSWVAA